MRAIGRQLTTNQDREQVFVDEYLIDLDPIQAAIRSGWSALEAPLASSRLLKTERVKTQISARLQARQQRTEITQDWVLYHLHRIVERCTQSVPVVDDMGRPTGTYRFDPSNALRGLELASKHLGMAPEQHKHIVESVPPGIEIIFVNSPEEAERWAERVYDAPDSIPHAPDSAPIPQTASHTQSAYPHTPAPITQPEPILPNIFDD